MDESLSRVRDELAPLSALQTLEHLVQRGRLFTQRQEQQQFQLKEENIDKNFQFTDRRRVPGCVATVHVQTVLDENQRIVGLRGTADAYIARGLLSVVNDIVTNQTVSALLSQQTNAITARSLQLDVSPGRNDGLQSLIQTIRDQVRDYIKHPSTNASIRPPLEPRQQQQEEQKRVNSNKKPTVALLLSGGVDSSVALHLLLETKQYDITCFYLKIWLQDELSHLGECPWEDDYNVCKKVCEQANVPLETVSLQEAYRDSVIQYTLAEARQGRTPNPDILCNSRIKFGTFLEQFGDQYDYVASGHYASLQRNKHTGRMRLFRAPDPVKDQSYFLCALRQRQLQKLLFPIGNLQKSEVRQVAVKLDLPNKARPDSQGLCFLGKVKFDSFLREYLGDTPGPIVDASNNEPLGRHRGLWYHTVGQRKGIGKVLDPLATSRGPWYVVAKDPSSNTLYCSNEYEEEAYEASRSQFTVENLQWIAGQAPSGTEFTMKIRHGPRLANGTMVQTSDTTANVQLERKDSGLAPGQYVVFYRETECLGCGVISERHWINLLQNLYTNETAVTLR